MFELFRRRLSGVKPSLDSIRFDSRGYTPRGEPQPGKARLWFTEEGDGVELYLFMVRPDLPNVRTVDDLRAFYAQGIQASGAQLVEISVLRVAGCPAINVIVKVPQKPSGMTYVGSLTIPFRGFSFVVKVQCEERGITGGREAVLMAHWLETHDLPAVLGDPMDLPDWHPDSEEFDAEFPGHPISRVRRVLQRVRDSLVIDEEVTSAAGFPLPLTRE
jgi:hypothetical protein